MHKSLRHAAIAVSLGSSLLLVPGGAGAQQQEDWRVSNVENRVATLERRIDNVEEEAAAGALVLLLFASFCALWAQNTGRSGWAWFFLGLFFNIFAVLVLLKKNSDDIDEREAG